MEEKKKIEQEQQLEEKKKKALDEDKLDEVNGGKPFLVIFN